MNLGCDIDTGFELKAEDENDRFHIQLYHHISKTVDLDQKRNSRNK
jgi:hypothetical protein